jgi:predicted nucleic acid-binding Zn ribbon protein
VRHRSGPRDLGSALDRIVARVEPQTPLSRLQRVWPQVAGEGVAPHAKPTAMSADGVVTITCEAAVWAQEVDLLSYELVQRLNVVLGPETVRELRCRGTESAAWARQGRRGRRTPPQKH